MLQISLTLFSLLLPLSVDAGLSQTYTGNVTITGSLLQRYTFDKIVRNTGGFVFPIAIGQNQTLMDCALDFESSQIMVLDERYCTINAASSNDVYQCYQRSATDVCNSTDTSCGITTPYYQCFYPCSYDYFFTDVRWLPQESRQIIGSTNTFFQWESLYDPIYLPSIPKCRFGVFDSIQSGDVSPLSYWLANFTQKLFTLDLWEDGSPSKLTLGGYAPVDMEWSNQRLKFTSWSSKYHMMVYGLTICGNDILPGVVGSSIPARLSLTDQCLVLPLPLYNAFMAYLPRTCDSSNQNCMVNMTYPGHMENTTVSFKLSEDGKEFKLPLSMISISYQDGTLGYCVQILPPTENTTLWEITFGSQFVESFLFTVDPINERIGLANKLLTDSYDNYNLTDSICLNQACSKPCSRNSNATCACAASNGTSQTEMESSSFIDLIIGPCQPNEFRSFNPETNACELGAGLIGFLTVVFVIMAITEFAAFLQYEMALKSITKSAADTK